MSVAHNTSRFALQPLGTLTVAALVVLCGAFPFPGSSAVPTAEGSGVFSCSCDPVSCEFSEDEGGVSDTLSVYVDIGGFDDLRGSSFVFTYDPSILEPVAVVPGDLQTSGPCPDFQVVWLNPGVNDGTLEIDQATLGCSLDGPGQLICIRFVGIMFGISPFLCQSSIARDSANQNIVHTCDIDCDLIFSSPPVGVELINWGRIKTLYAGPQE